MNSVLDMPGTSSPAGLIDKALCSERYLVAQVGARMHYAVPSILEKAGMLARLCTDICAVRGWPRILRLVPRAMRPAALRRLLARSPAGVPASKIRAFTAFGCNYALRSARARNSTDQTKADLWAGRRFCELIVGEGLAGITGVYAFNTAALELFRYARSQKVQTVLEQTIAPRQTEIELLAEENERYPDWGEAQPSNSVAQQASTREHAEWKEADIIVCGSEFVKESIARCGGPVERCVVVPYGVQMQSVARARRPHDGPLRVLTVGAIGLRKGSPYVLEVAKRMQGQAVFRLVGSVNVPRPAADSLRQWTQLIGPVPRPEMAQHYDWADVFFLPSLCEGSATATYEALASGMPVVCTPNTGSVVRDRVDGYVVPVRDPAGLAARLEHFATDRAHLEAASISARQRAREFTLEQYSSRLMEVLSGNGVKDPQR